MHDIFPVVFFAVAQRKHVYDERVLANNSSLDYKAKRKFTLVLCMLIGDHNALRG